MIDERPVSKWIGIVKAGADQDAEQGLWEAYFERLLALARVKLDNLPPTWEDEAERRLRQIRKQLLALMEDDDESLRAGE